MLLLTTSLNSYLCIQNHTEIFVGRYFVIWYAIVFPSINYNFYEEIDVLAFLWVEIGFAVLRNIAGS